MRFNQHYAAALALILFSGAAFSLEMPTDWPQLKPGMVRMETKMAGMGTSTMTSCVTQAAHLASMNKLQHGGDTCKPPVFSKTGATSVVKMMCNPKGSGPVTVTTEAALVSANQIKMKITAVGGKVGNMPAQEILMTRTGDCTGKEAPQMQESMDADMAAQIEQLKREAAAKKRKP